MSGKPKSPVLSEEDNYSSDFESFDERSEPPTPTDGGQEAAADPIADADGSFAEINKQQAIEIDARYAALQAQHADSREQFKDYREKLAAIAAAAKERELEEEDIESSIEDYPPEPNESAPAAAAAHAHSDIDSDEVAEIPSDDDLLMDRDPYNELSSHNLEDISYQQLQSYFQRNIKLSTHWSLSLKQLNNLFPPTKVIKIFENTCRHDQHFKDKYGAIFTEMNSAEQVATLRDYYTKSGESRNNMSVSHSDFQASLQAKDFWIKVERKNPKQKIGYIADEYAEREKFSKQLNKERRSLQRILDGHSFSNHLTRSKKKRIQQKLSELKEFTLGSGWKLHLHLDEDKVNIAQAWNIVMLHLYKRQIPEAKMYVRGNSMNKTKDQKGKQITIYLGSHDLVRSNMLNIETFIKHVERDFMKFAIKPAKCNPKDLPIHGSKYFSYRNDRLDNGLYFDSKSKIPAGCSQHNPSSEKDPFADFQIKSHYTRSQSRKASKKKKKKKSTRSHNKARLWQQQTGGGSGGGSGGGGGNAYVDEYHSSPTHNSSDDESKPFNH